MTNFKRLVISTRLTKQESDRIKAFAESRRVTQSVILRKLLEAWFAGRILLP